MDVYDFLDFDDCTALNINEFIKDEWIESHGSAFSVFNINIRSIKNKFPEFVSMIKMLSMQFTFIIVTETMLTCDLDYHFEIEGCKSTAVYRTVSGGGIKVYWRDSLNVKIIDYLTGLFPSHEAVFIQTKITDMATVTIGAIYRPPSSSVNAFREYIEVHVMSKKFKNLILAGDFNINVLLVNNERYINEFVSMMHSHGYYNYINTETYFSPIHGRAVSILDHFWHNILKPCKSYVISPPLADHLPCCLIFENEVKADLIDTKFRDFSIKNRARFVNNLEIECTLFNPPISDANESACYIVNRLKSLCNKYFPVKLKSISQKRADAPWLSTRLIKCIRKKHWLFSLFKRNKINYDMYRTYSLLLRYVLGIAERIYHKTKFKSCKNNTRKTWKHLNHLLGRSTSVNPEEFNINGNVIHESKEITKSFAKYFDEIPTITQANVGLSNVDLLHFVPITNNSLFLYPATANEVKSLITSLKNSNDLVDIPVLLLKISNQMVCEMLSKLYNLCLVEGVYPDLFKVARVIPIFKKGDRSLISNYRPISILPILNKIFEKLTLLRLNSFIHENCLIAESQHGFRSGFSTDSAMLDLMRYILPAYSEKLYAVCIFLDFSKAFDTVNHQILINKLERYGIRGHCLEFFRSYLDNRLMYVNYNNQNSQHFSVNLSVPQGSCMGPVLFNLYINDLNYYLSEIAKVIYADDTTLVVVSDDMDYMTRFINDTLRKMTEWCKFNRLCLNTDKTKFMILSPMLLPYEPVFIINSEPIERVTCFKFLGVEIDDKLKFHEQTNSLCNKLSRFCGITYRLAQYYTFDVALTFYHSFVYPAISYGIIVWGGALVHTVRINRAQCYQNRIIKNLFRKYYQGVTIDEIYTKLQILKIKDLYKLKCAEFMYKIMILNYYPNLKTFLMSACVEHPHHTRRCRQIRPTFPRVDVIKYSFWFQFIAIWNEIPEHIMNSATIHKFKAMLVAHMFGDY
jgi:hypothetical protein